MTVSSFLVIVLVVVNAVFCDTLTLAGGLSVEPYIMSEHDAGFEVDIVREALESEGYTVQFIYSGLKRSKSNFLSNKIDGVMTIQANYPHVKNGYISNNYITYRNSAISLKKSSITLKGMNELSQYSIIAYQQASLGLGPEFQKIAESHSNYQEFSDQEKQVALLFRKRVEVIIIDYYIYLYFKNRIADKYYINIKEEVNVAKLFPPTEYQMAFKSKTVCAAFNRGLKKLKESGRYQKIIDGYIDRKVVLKNY